MSTRMRPRNIRDSSLRAPYAPAIKGVISATVEYSDAVSGTLTELLGSLPSGSRFIRAWVNVITAFDAGTTNVLTIGTAADTDYLLTDGHPDVADSESEGELLDYSPTSDVNIYATYTYTGTAPTAGEAICYVEFEQP